MSDHLHQAEQVELLVGLEVFERVLDDVQTKLCSVLSHARVRFDSLTAPALPQKATQQKAGRGADIQQGSWPRVAPQQSRVTPPLCLPQPGFSKVVRVASAFATEISVVIDALHMAGQVVRLGEPVPASGAGANPEAVLGEDPRRLTSADRTWSHRTTHRFEVLSCTTAYNDGVN